MANLTISIPYADLERLIGDNTEANVELRAHIVEEFAKRHFKNVAAEPAFQEAIRSHELAIRQTTTGILNEYFKTSRGTYGDVVHTATKEFESHIRALVDTQIREVINDRIQERIANYTEKLDATVKRFVDEDYSKRINLAVRERIAAVLRAAE